MPTQPLMSMVVFTIFFGHLAKVPSRRPAVSGGVGDGAGAVDLLRVEVVGGSTSLSGYQHIISKVYFRG